MIENMDDDQMHTVRNSNKSKQTNNTWNFTDAYISAEEEKTLLITSL